MEPSSKFIPKFFGVAGKPREWFVLTFAASTVSTCETRAFKQMQKIGDSQQLWMCVGAGVRDGEMWNTLLLSFTKLESFFQ